MQTNRGRRWEYLLFTWKRLGAGRASSAPSAPRPATSAAAVLASRGGGGGGGADMELRSRRRLPHRALCGEQGKTRRAAEQETRSKCRTTGKSPRRNSPQTLCEGKRRIPVLVLFFFFLSFSSLKPFSGQTARCTVASQITSLISLFLGSQ